MDALTRRKFLMASGVVGAAAITTGAAAFAVDDIFGTAGTEAALEQTNTVVLITLYGGNDGLNTVIPYNEPAYHDARPGMSYEPAQVLPLDDGLGLNPAMTGFAELFKSKNLAVVRGVGYPKPDHSHFRAMDIWQTANPREPVRTGWVGRWLDAVGGDPRRAVSFEPVLPVVLAGAKSAGAAVNPRGLRLPNGLKTKTLVELGGRSHNEPPLQARAAGCFNDLVEIDNLVKNLTVDQNGNVVKANGPKATGTGGNSALARQLGLVAKFVEAGVATRVFSVSLGGFDTHADEKPSQERLLGELDQAVTAFVTRMAQTDRGRKVVVVIYSEFGRRVKANASLGTDHGTASDVFVLGTHVAGGFYGDQPSLTNLDDGDLEYTVDFRSIYASVLEQALKMDPARVLGQWKGRIKGLLTF